MDSVDAAMLGAEATALDNSGAEAAAGPGFLQQDPITNDDSDEDSDVRRCVVCTTDVALDDVCWIEANCEPHSHVYHIDCLCLWWLETNRRPCPRCTLQVNLFVIHARPVTGNTVTRTFRALLGNCRAVTDELVLVDQSAGFRSIVRPEPFTPGYSAGTESVRAHIDAFDALVGWIVHLWRDKQDVLAVEGMARVRAIVAGWVRLEHGRMEDLLVTWNLRPLNDSDTTGGDGTISPAWSAADALRLRYDMAVSDREESSDYEIAAIPGDTVWQGTWRPGALHSLS